MGAAPRRRLRRRRFTARRRGHGHDPQPSTPARIRRRGVPAKAIRHGDAPVDHRPPDASGGPSMTDLYHRVDRRGLRAVLRGPAGPVRPGAAMNLIDLLTRARRRCSRSCTSPGRCCARRTSRPCPPTTSSCSSSCAVAILDRHPAAGRLHREGHGRRADVPQSRARARRARHLSHPRGRPRQGAGLEELHGLDAPVQPRLHRGHVPDAAAPGCPAAQPDQRHPP